MLDIVKRSNEMYPLISNSALIMSIGTLSKSDSDSAHDQSACASKPTVKAATVLHTHSCTEIIDVSGLSQKQSPLIEYVEIADTAGRLYCVDRHVNTPCWLKIVTIAKDCQSCNVLLMTTDKGVVLKVIRSITPGEQLEMWFTENILAMLNMPYLTNLNIRGQNRYICHMCNNHFEYPNPLKIHLALKCNRLDSNYLWMQLAKEFTSMPRPSLSIFEKVSPFSFELTGSPRASPSRISPIVFDPKAPHGFTSITTAFNNSVNLSNDSPISSNQTSPTSSNQASPTSPSRRSYFSSTSSVTQVSPVKKNLGQQHSAFKPYINKPNVFPTSVLPPPEKPIVPPYHVQPAIAPAPIEPDAQAAQMETIVSNLGKSKQGHLCIYCGKLYSRKYGLKIHIRTHTGYKPLKCKYCLRPFGDPSNLNKHVRLHAEGDTPYRCDLCGKVLVRRRDLERHIRSRHQDSADQISDASSDGMDV